MPTSKRLFALVLVLLAGVVRAHETATPTSVTLDNELVFASTEGTSLILLANIQQLRSRGLKQWGYEDDEPRSTLFEGQDQDGQKSETDRCEDHQ